MKDARAMRHARALLLTTPLLAMGLGATLPFLTQCKPRAASDVKGDVKVAESWWTKLLGVVNDAVGKTDGAKLAADGLDPRLNAVQQTKATAQRRQLLTDVEAVHAEVEKLLLGASTLLDELKKAVYFGYTDTQPNEKKIRDVPENRAVTVGGKARDWGVKGILAEAEAIHQRLSTDVRDKLRAVAVKNTTDAEVQRARDTLGDFRKALASARADLVVLQQGVRSWFDPTEKDPDTCKPLGDSADFTHNGCEWRPAFDYLRFMTSNRPCVGALPANEIGTLPVPAEATYYDDCRNEHVRIKARLQDVFAWMNKDQANYTWKDPAAPGQATTLATLMKSFARSPFSVTVVPGNAVDYDVSLNALRVGFDFRDARFDLKQAFVAKFGIAAGQGASGSGQWPDMAVDLNNLPTDYNQDKTGSATPLTYKPENAKLPIDLPQKRVLAAMEAIRARWHQFDVAPGTQPDPAAEVDKYSRDSCLENNDATHWSDITHHFYCQYGYLRECYTYRARSGQARRLIYQECQQAKLNDGSVNRHKDGYAWIVQNHDDVFQAMMFSQTFAYKFDQQQEVINRFYRVKLSKPDYTAADTADVAECRAKRPRRMVDPSDGTHCSTAKTYCQPYQSVCTPINLKAIGR